MNTNCWYCEEGCIKGYEDNFCDEHCSTFKSLKNSFKLSNLPMKYWYPFSLKSIEVDKKEISQLSQIRGNLSSFVNEGKNLLIQSSNCGNGKTSWGIKLLQKQIENNYKKTPNFPVAFYLYTPDLLLEARKSISKRSHSFDLYELVMEECPLVLLDDVGCIPIKDYDMLVLSNLIEKRISKGLSTIYTTNLVGETLKTNLGERLFDRIYRDSTIITFKSGSMRGKNE